MKMKTLITHWPRKSSSNGARQEEVVVHNCIEASLISLFCAHSITKNERIRNMLMISDSVRCAACTFQAGRSLR